ncbi:PTS sugar transporter subunit IIA [bacterium]|nr:PTS sugar transporter subunit IIA [bacterium]
MNKLTVNLEEVMTPAIIDFHMTTNSKQAAIRHLGELLKADGRVVDVDLFVADVLAREQIESTNMDIGVAIPHGMSDAITKNSIAIGRLAEPIEWNPGEDKKKVRVIFLMAVESENRNRTHLELLSRMATLLLKDQFLDLLFNSDDKQAILESVHTLLEA